MTPQRPGHPSFVAARPEDVAVINTLGGARFDDVVLTDDQVRALRRTYGFDSDVNRLAGMKAYRAADEAYRKALAEYEALSRKEQRFPYTSMQRPAAPQTSLEDWIRHFQTGADRNMIRFAQEDGLRVMAFLATFLDEGDDPVRLVESICIQAGYDCGVSDWPDETDEAEEAE